MKQFLDRCAYAFTAALAVAFCWFVSVEYECSKPHALGYNACNIAEMDMLVVSVTEPDYDAIPRLSVNDLK